MLQALQMRIPQILASQAGNGRAVVQKDRCLAGNWCCVPYGPAAKRPGSIDAENCKS